MTDRVVTALSLFIQTLRLPKSSQNSKTPLRHSEVSEKSEGNQDDSLTDEREHLGRVAYGKEITC